MRHVGTANMKPVRTESEAKEKGRKGGLASGRARRRKKTIRETLRALRDMPVADAKYREFLKKNDVDEKDMTYAVLLSMKMIAAACRGNSQMMQLLIKTLGDEIDADKLEVTGKDGAPLSAAPAVQIYLPDNGR